MCPNPAYNNLTIEKANEGVQFLFHKPLLYQ